MKRLALEGLGLRSIGRVIGVSNVAVLKWIRAYGLKAGDLPEINQEIKEVEINEMHSYIESKNPRHP